MYIQSEMRLDRTSQRWCDSRHLYLFVELWLWTIPSASSAEDQGQELYLFELADVAYCYTLLTQRLLIAPIPTDRGMARLSWPGWLATYRDSLPTGRRSLIQALTILTLVIIICILYCLLNLFERINDDDTLHTKTFSTSSIRIFCASVAEWRFRNVADTVISVYAKNS